VRRQLRGLQQADVPTAEAARSQGSRTVVIGCPSHCVGVWGAIALETRCTADTRVPRGCSRHSSLSRQRLLCTCGRRKSGHICVWRVMVSHRVCFCVCVCRRRCSRSPSRTS
jgi:hypothetical protein